MYDEENWETIADEEVKELLERSNPVDGLYPVSVETTQARKRSLPFYDQALLVRLTDPSWDDANLALFYLFEKDTLYRLNGQSNPIHELNAKVALTLTEENVLDYLRFFAFFVRGEEGAFLIVEDIQNPDLPQDMDNHSRETLEKYLRPAAIEGETEDGSFLCKAPVFYSNALFISTFEVSRSGVIDIREHETVAADLPFTANVPIS